MRRFRLLGLSTIALSTLLDPLRGSEQLTQDLKRIFDSKELTPKRFGPARWRDNGSSYTMVEPASKPREGDDIVLYETATGKRSVLVPASELCPPGASKPLSIDD